jgi:pimeloyl-ACP methyl ester carboxylesterase
MKTSQYRTIRNLKIAYNRKGNGEVVLLIRGITTSSFIWRKIQPDLAEYFDTIAIDLLGCGDSSCDLSADYSIKNQADLIAELIKDMILINTIGYNYWPVQPITTMRTPIFRQIAMMTLDMGMLQKVIKRGLCKKESYTEEFKTMVWKEMADKKRRKSFLHFARCLNNQHLMEIAPELQKISCPVLIIRGEGDLYLSRIISMTLMEDIPNCKFISIKTGGHYIQEDEPELITSSIIDFFRKNQSR